MRWEDITKDGAWIIPIRDAGEGNANELALPQIASDIIDAQTRFAGNPLRLCGGVGSSPTIGFARAKQNFLAKLPEMPQGRLHDLRRTARSLMSRAGVRPDIAERVLGHAIAGVGGIYDRHTYREEKAQALRALAGLIESITNPPSQGRKG